MKKILLNAYIDLNLGDDLFLKILFDRYTNVKWILPKGGDKYKKIFAGYKNVVIKDDIFFKIKNKIGIKEKNGLLSRYDAGVYIGGSIFMQISQWKEQLLERKEVIRSFRKGDKPYFILGANFGPFNNETFVNEYKSLFKSCKDICFRDMYSKALFNDFENVRVAPDIVFQIKPQKAKKIKNSIGISLIDIKSRGDLKQYDNIYKDKLKSIVEIGIEKGKNFTFFSFCEAQGDMAAIEDVVNRINYKYRDKINVVNYTGDIDKFLYSFESMENIIGARYHSCILSQVFEQGLYPLIYSNKTYNVLNDLNLNKEYSFINKIDELDINNLYNVIDNNRIFNKQIIEQSEKQFKELDKYVNEN